MVSVLDCLVVLLSSTCYSFLVLCVVSEREWGWRAGGRPRRRFSTWGNVQGKGLVGAKLPVDLSLQVTADSSLLT